MRVICCCVVCLCSCLAPHAFPVLMHSLSCAVQAERVVRLGDGKIAGIVMEKANGQNVDKTLKDPK